ncbi:MAG: hypothetical protein K1X74_10655 [Pirellulales bacterium]|nr:hypothetical protein [Pirellulales bacterium]
MRRAHHFVGLLSVVAFLATGLYLRFGLGGIDSQPDVVRLLLRSDHVYLLLVGLINVTLGLYLQPASGRRGMWQKVGSAALLAAPLLLLTAFCLEPWSCGLGRRPWTAPAMIVTFAGVILHWSSQRRQGCEVETTP